MKNKRVFSFRTKAEVILLVGLLICMSVVSVMSVTRTITDSSDTIETYIRNSNGNYWEATGSNIQLAIDDLSECAGTVRLPSGTFYTSAAIDMYPPQNLIGDGRESTFIRSTIDDGTPIIKVHDTATNSGSIKGMRITSTDGHSTGAGIYLDDTYMFVVDEITFYDLDTWCIELYDTLVTEITNCKFTKTVEGGIKSTWGTSIDIHGNDFEQYDGIGIDLNGTNGCWIHDNWFENGAVHDAKHIYIHSEARDTTHNKIYSNRFASTGLSNLYSIHLESITNDVIWTIIEGNSISDRVMLNSSQYKLHNNIFRGITAGTVVESNAMGEISNNHFYYINADYSIELGTHTGTVMDNDFLGGSATCIYVSSYDHLVSGNYFRTCTGTSMYINGNENSITNNHFSNFGTYGLDIFQGSDNFVSGNFFEGSTTATYVHGNSDQNIITNNNYIDGGISIQIDGACDRTNITGNYLDGSIVDSGTDTLFYGNIGYNYDSLQDNYIWTSSGHYYPETEAGLQDAIDVLTTGGTIYGNEFNITVNTPIAWDESINFEGTGKTSVLYLADSVNNDVLQISGKSNILISGLCIRANGDAQTDNSVSCIDITGTSSNITIRDCYLYKGSKSLIDCQEDTSHITVENCFIDGKKNCGYGGGIWFSGSYCNALHNTICNTYGSGIVMEAQTGQPSSKYCVIDGNTITGETAHGIHMEGDTGQDYPKASNATIINNIIYDLNSTAYVVSESHWSMGILVEENSIVSNNRIINVQKYGILVKHDNSKIYGNTIKNTKKTSVRIAGNKTIFADNYVIDSQDNYAVLVEQNYVTITGNKIYSPSGYFIYAYTSDGARNNLIISDNECVNGGSHGLWVKDYDYVTITGNIIDGVLASRAGMHLEDGSNMTVTGNVITDDGDGSDGIDLDVIIYSVISGNIAYGFSDSIDEHGASDYNIITSNQFNDGIRITANNNVIANNIGALI